MQIGVNVITQIALLTFILIVINVLGFHYYKRWNFSLGEQNDLSDKTRQVLASLSEPLTLSVILPAQGFPMIAETQNLLEEYKHAGRPHVRVDILDTYKDFARVTALQGEHNFSESESIIIVSYAGRSKIVEGMDLFSVDASMAMFGEQPQVTAFLGEQKITGAILEVVEGRRPVVYYTQGHLEPALVAEAPLGLFHVYLDRDNIGTEPLTLASTDQVPEEAAMVAIFAPQYDFTDRDLELLGRYWEHGGRLFVALDPEPNTPKLDAFLAARGITPHGDRVLQPVAIDDQTSLVFDQVPGVFESGSPITEKLVGAAGVLTRGTQSLGLPQPDAQKGWEIQSLIQAPPGFWGEVNHTAIQEEGLIFEEGVDFGEPLTLAASVRKAGVDDPRVSLGGARMVVVGNGRFLDESDLVEPNLVFAIAAVNWLTDREAFIGIPPREMKNFVLRVSSDQFWNITYLVILAIPGLALALGVMVWWNRRH